MSFLYKTTDRIFVVIGALVFSQLPLFYSQYLHQLEGHRGELLYQFNLLEQSAKSSGKSIGAWVSKFLSSQDTDIRLQGEFLQALLSRLELLTEAVSKLTEAHFVEKPFLLIRYFDSQITHSTWQHFQPGIPLTLEGGFYALAGMFFGYGLFKGLAWMVRKIFPGLSKARGS